MALTSLKQKISAKLRPQQGGEHGVVTYTSPEISTSSSSTSSSSNTKARSLEHSSTSTAAAKDTAAAAAEPAYPQVAGANSQDAMSEEEKQRIAGERRKYVQAYVRQNVDRITQPVTVCNSKVFVPGEG